VIVPSRKVEVKRHDETTATSSQLNRSSPSMHISTLDALRRHLPKLVDVLQWCSRDKIASCPSASTRFQPFPFFWKMENGSTNHEQRVEEEELTGNDGQCRGNRTQGKNVVRKGALTWERRRAVVRRICERVAVCIVIFLPG
jgi:hypothetical protein